MKTPIRLLIADDHALFRGGLKSLLRRQRDMRVVGEVESAGGLMEALSNTACDILLLDLQMERWVLDDIRQLSALTNVVVLTASENSENAVIAMRSGARAIVQKRFAVQTLIDAIHTVANGLVWMPAELQAEILSQWRAPDSEQLTGREVEIARQVATGLRNAEIAALLSITEATVKTHLVRIFEKLKLRDRVELAVYATRHGLVARRD